MYSLKVKKELTLDDGRLFLPGHEAKALDAFEVSELMSEYPDHFEPADEATAEFLSDPEKVAHLADAMKRKKVEGTLGSQGNLSARKKK